jgi:hypothetical protein
MRNILAMAALSTALAAASLAYAQTTSSTKDNQGSVDHHMDNVGGSGGEDAPNYLTGPGVHLFYTDEGMTTLRPMGEMRTVYLGMSPTEQVQLTRACFSNEDTRFADFCAAVGTF